MLFETVWASLAIMCSLKWISKNLPRRRPYLLWKQSRFNLFISEKEKEKEKKTKNIFQISSHDCIWPNPVTFDRSEAIPSHGKGAEAEGEMRSSQLKWS